MEISGISSQDAAVIIQESLVEPDAVGEDPVDDPIITPDADEQGEDADGGKGMIDKLLGGHFNGVADVRLRIVHYDKLAALENSEVTSAVSSGVGGVTESVGGAIEEFLGSGDAISEDDQAAVRESYEVFAEAMSAIGGEEVVAEAENAFSQLVEAIRDLLGEEGGEDGAVEAFISGLEDSLAEGLAQLQAEIDGVDVFGEVSEANGKGGAYDKFLAVYNELRDFEAAEGGGVLPA